MSSAPTILRPETTVPLASETVTLRDLPWQDVLEFLRRLSAHAHELLAAAADANGQVNLQQLLPKLADLITKVEGLAEFLITKSAEKNDAWLKERSTLEVLALLDGALEVNLSDGLLALGKKVAGRLKRVMPAKETMSATPPLPTS